MTGPEHYREAERHLIAAASTPPNVDTSYMTAAAQVHATLALAAATVDVAIRRGPGDVRPEWLEIT